MNRSLLCVAMPDAVASSIRNELQDWDVRVVRGLEEADRALRTDSHRVVVLWMSTSSTGSATRIQDIVTRHRHTVWIAVTEPAALECPILADLVAQCFLDYHTLPLDAARLVLGVGHAHGISTMRQAAIARHHEEGGEESEMVGTSAQMRAVFRSIRRVASADAPVLIAGESGTGKELAAQAIHERSRRARAPFLAVNCAALPPGLIQSELFGHERGAFTGAHARRIGHIEAAEGGTLFLDEIGDIPLELQVHLLRFLQESQIQRVGGNETLRVDVRIIAATNVDLELAVQEGKFREDLYYRLNVLHLGMPPLREREGDIELLARFFFEKFVRQEKSRVKGFTRRALETINMHDWPGNVREMINRVRRAIVMCEGDFITPADLGLERRRASREPTTLEQARIQSERDAIQNALRRHMGNVTQAARELGVSRMTMYRLLDKHKLEEPSSHPRRPDDHTENVVSLHAVSSARRLQANR